MSAVNVTPLIEAELVKYIDRRLSELAPDEYLGLRFVAKDKPKLSGLYRDRNALVRDIKRCAGQYQIYCCLNPIKRIPDLSLNSLKPGKSFKDIHVSRIMHVMIDVDPQRPPNTAATVQELINAYDVAMKIEQFLRTKGIFAELFSSGNGYHLLIKVPSYQTHRKNEVEALLGFLDKTFSTNEVKVDTAVSNPSRVCRVPWTLNIKGSNTPERPYRLAQQMTSFNGPAPEQDILESLKGEINEYHRSLSSQVSESGPPNAPLNMNKTKGDYSKYKGNIATLDIIGLFKGANRYVKPVGDGKHSVICPNRHQHSENSDGTSATVIFEKGPGQWPGFKCQHDHCQHLNLEKVLDYFPPEDVDRFCFHEFVNLKQPSMPPPSSFDDFRLVKLKDLLSEPEEKVQYIVDGLLVEGGFSLMASKPKVGKTTFLRALAVAVSQGDDFLGFKTKKCCVLYLALEEHKVLMRREFERLNVREGDSLLIHIGPAPIDAVEKLRPLIEQRRPELIIVDTMQKLVRIQNGNDYAEVNSRLEPLFALARQYNCHILCTHHLSKAQEREPEDTILGSTAIFAAVDTTVILAKDKSEERIIHTIQRYGENLPKHAVRLDPVTRSPYLVSVSEIKQVNISDEIFKVLRNSSQGLTAEQIIKQVGKRGEDVTKTLKDLYSQQIVARAGTGKKGSPYIYSIPVNAIPPLEGEDGNSIISHSIPNSGHQEGNGNDWKIQPPPPPPQHSPKGERL